MKNCSLFKNQSGFTAIFLGLSLVMLMGFAAIAVDLGYLYAARNELQNAADAAALSGARELGKIYTENKTYTANTAKAGDTYRVFLAAKEVAGKNIAAGESISLKVFALKDDNGNMVIDENNVSPDGADVVLGQWQWTAPSGTDKLKTVGVDQPDAVRVYAKRQQDVNPVTLFFARVLGIADRGVSAVATAALSGLSEIKEGELDLPIGISDTWFDRGWECGKNILFYPTKDSCAGWTNWTDANNDKVSDPDLKTDIFPGLINKTLTAPGATFNETRWWFTGGNLSKNTWEKLDELFQANKDASGQWKVRVVVYHFSGDGETSCGNPNPSDGPLLIVGFATLIMEEVVVPPSKEGEEPQKSLQGAVYCDVVDDRGGGNYYGTLGSIPGLVQ
jgi:Flp pilus assembly protein TadG